MSDKENEQPKRVGRPPVYALDADRRDAIKASKKKYYENNKEKYQKYYLDSPVKNKEAYDKYNKSFRYGGYFLISNGEKGDIHYSKSMYFRIKSIKRDLKSEYPNSINKKYTGDNWKMDMLEIGDKNLEIYNKLIEQNKLPPVDKQVFIRH